ncbi:MAG: hypothetical protein Q9221_002349 [Calogaya cf. arnoldii]
MANSDPFEIPSSFWDEFTDLPGLNDCAAATPGESKDGSTPSKSNIGLEPATSTSPSQPCSTDAQGVQCDGLQADDFLIAYEQFSDFLLNDELWKSLNSGPSLADLETAPKESVPAGSSNVLGSRDSPGPITENVSYADFLPDFGPNQSSQAAISSAPPVPLAEPPVTTPFGGPQLVNWQSQGPAPPAVMYQSPYMDDWFAANQAVYQEPKAAVMPTPQSHKRKAVEFDDCVGPSTSIPIAKRQKTQPPLRAIHPKKAVSNRIENIQTFVGSQVYDPLPHRPRNWSIFKYTANGELEPGKLYTAEQIQYYLYRHPLQTLSDGSMALKQGRLRLRIQRNPPARSDSKRRYPDPSQSNRCRFKQCFATNNIMNQGHLRLCFDEYWHLNNENFRTDPFHNAGYVHLNCLERFLDFPQLCHDLPIMLDDRDMPLEPDCRNLMSLAPRHNLRVRNMYDVASSFLYECNTETLVGYPRGARPHPGTFVWRLMLAKVGPSFQLGVTKDSNAEVHLGDLELEFAGRK